MFLIRSPLCRLDSELSSAVSASSKNFLALDRREFPEALSAEGPQLLLVVLRDRRYHSRRRDRNQTGTQDGPASRRYAMLTRKLTANLNDLVLLKTTFEGEYSQVALRSLKAYALKGG